MPSVSTDQSNRKELVRGYLAIVTTSLLWSLGGLFIKLIPWAPFSINGARCLIALGFKAVVRRSVKIKFTKLSVIGGICMSATTILFSSATKFTTSANAIMLQFAYPIFLLLYTWAYTKKRPARIDIFTSLVIIGGVFLCCLDSLGSGGMFGNMLGLLSGVTFSGYFFVNSLPDGSPDDANFLGFLLGAITGLPSLVKETVFSADIIIYIVILGAVQLGLSYLIFEYGIKRVPAVSASFITAIEPIMNPVWVAIFYGETIGSSAVVGSVLVIGATLGYSIINARRAAR